jgi:hypothetical protein
MNKTKKPDPLQVPGFQFRIKTQAQRERALAIMAAAAERKKNGMDKPPHGHGDPNAEVPGDKPEAYDPGLTQEQFDLRFTGSMDDIAAITSSDGTQSYGRLLEGFVPAPGHELDGGGCVVKVGQGA